MKDVRTVLPVLGGLLSSAIWMPFTAYSGDFHSVCKDARDYAGCIKHHSSKSQWREQPKVKFEMASISENEAWLRKEHASVLKGFNNKNKCILLDLVCIEFSSGNDQFERPIPYGWFGYHLGEPWSTYLFPIPEIGVDLTERTNPLGRYLIFTGFSRSLTDEIPATQTINLGSAYASTKCRTNSSSSIRQSGVGNVTLRGSSAGRISATGSGFDFDVNSYGSLNCNTESGPPTIIWGTPGQRGGEVYQMTYRTVVDCKNNTQIDSYWLARGQSGKRKKYLSSVNGTLRTHTIHAPLFKSLCDLHLSGKVNYPLSAINPVTGKRHAAPIIEMVKEAAYKFFR